MIGQLNVSNLLAGGPLVTCHVLQFSNMWHLRERGETRCGEISLRPEATMPAAVSAGRARKRGVRCLGVDPVCAFVLVGFEGLDGVARLFHGAGHEPADGVLLPSHLVHDLRQSGAVFPLEHSDHLGGLAALARRGGFLGCVANAKPLAPRDVAPVSKPP